MRISGRRKRNSKSFEMEVLFMHLRKSKKKGQKRIGALEHKELWY
jgi:hypothetical protein